MEIKNIGSVLNSYNKIKMNTGKAKTAPAGKKTDVIEINYARSVDAAKAGIAASVKEDAAPEKIAQLKAAVENNSYEVSPEEIAEAILMF